MKKSADSTKEKSARNPSSENGIEFNSLMDEAIKRIVLLKLNPNMQSYLSTEIPPNGPSFNAVLDGAVKNIRQLKLGLGKGITKNAVCIQKNLQQEMDEYQKHWQDRLLQFSEMRALPAYSQSMGRRGKKDDHCKTS